MHKRIKSFLLTDMYSSFSRMGSLLFLALAVVGTTITIASSSNNPVWADVFEGTEGDDLIDSKGGE